MNSQYSSLLIGEPLNILPTLLKDKNCNIWYEKSDYIRENLSQQDIKSFYLVLLEAAEKESPLNEDESNYNRLMEDLDIFWYAMSNKNAIEVELISKDPIKL